MSYDVEEAVLREVHGVAIREQRKLEELPQFFASGFRELGEYVGNISPSNFGGAPFARYFSWPPQLVDVELVFPVVEPLPGGGRVYAVHLPGGPAAQVLHEGPYDQMSPAYEAIEQWLETHHRTRSEPPREVYLTGPEEDPQQTLVVQPLQP